MWKYVVGSVKAEGRGRLRRVDPVCPSDFVAPWVADECVLGRGAIGVVERSSGCNARAN
jgi:hypothetical protein